MSKKEKDKEKDKREVMIGQIADDLYYRIKAEKFTKDQLKRLFEEIELMATEFLPQKRGRGGINSPFSLTLLQI